MNEIFQLIDKGAIALIAALIAAFASMVNLLIASSLSRTQEKLKNKLEKKRTIDKESREFRLKQLTDFYDPIFTLLAANGDIFAKIGPTSEARKSKLFNDSETSEVWKKLTNEVIVPNNMKICEIIQKKLHLISDSDDESVYLEFLSHAHAYQVFKVSVYEAYRLFPFPQSVMSSVFRERARLKSEVFSTYDIGKKGIIKWLCTMRS